MTAKRAPLGTKSGAGPHFTAIADATGPWACRTNGMASATTATARRRIVGSELRGGEEHSGDSGDGKSHPTIVAHYDRHEPDSPREGPAPRGHCRGRWQHNRVVRLLHLRQPGDDHHRYPGYALRPLSIRSRRCVA